MPARVERCEGTPPTAEEVDARLRAEDLRPSAWSNAPGDTYDWHAHGYEKVLYCVSGGITFHLDDGDDVELRAGDRLEVAPGTRHAATVGPEGVRCTEAPR
jgi:quercetin dioxygenase-like cupin family protein